MSTQQQEAPLEGVATPSPDAGKEVWCENGCGNRILDLNERIPFACPTGCGGMMTEEKPDTSAKMQKVRLPELGRIVHVRISPTIHRPAIVAGRDVAANDGRIYVHVFADESDPKPPGLYDNTGIVSYGSGLGQWQWPEHGEHEFFETDAE